MQDCAFHTNEKLQNERDGRMSVSVDSPAVASNDKHGNNHDRYAARRARFLYAERIDIDSSFSF